MSEDATAMGSTLEGQRAYGKYSTKTGAAKYFKGSFDGLLSAAAVYGAMKYFPDMSESDREYMILVVVPMICGVPPTIRNWLKNHKLGRAITWYVLTKYNKAIKKVFKGIPDEVVNDTHIEEQ
jgi:hypothetical protein